MPAEGTVNTIDLSLHDPAKAYMAVYKYRESDFAPYIFKTENYGKSWKLLTDGNNGIPAHHFVRVVREDPDREGLLYAGTEFGMYISFNDGKNWQSFQQNLPITPITDLKVYRKDLVVATQGRSFWIMDDLSPLHLMEANNKLPAYTLYEPRVSYRTQMRGFRGSQAPESAPRGAIIYFELDASKVDTSKVEVHILDGTDQVVRIYKAEPDKDEGERKLEAVGGMNKLVWDHSYTGPNVISSAQFSLANTGGTVAPTGTYQVRLITDQGEVAHLFQVEKDPRWDHISDEGLRDQYKLTVQVRELLTSCHDAIRKIRAMREQIKIQARRAVKAGFSESLEDQAQMIADRLTALEEELIQTQSESGQDPINYPPMLDDQIAYLYSTVNAQDARPTAGCYERYEDLSQALNMYLDQLNEIMEKDIKAFEERLEQEGVPRFIPVDK